MPKNNFIFRAFLFAQCESLFYLYLVTETNQPTKNMTTANAAKKLTKAGFNVSEIRNGFYRASSDATKYVIEYFRNGGSDEITCINVRSLDDKHDSQSDYCAGVWANNITQAIAIAD
jgi:hypothetical protein